MSNTYFCGKCGAPMGEGHAFCRNCGHKAEIPSEPQAAQQTAAHFEAPVYHEPAPKVSYNPMISQTAYMQPRKKGTALLILSIAFFILAAAAIAAVFFFGPYGADPKDLSGNWDLSVTAEKIFNDETSYINKEDLNDTKDVVMKLTLDKDGKGTMNINDYVVLDLAYSNGKLAAAGIKDDTLKITFDGTVKKEKDELSIKGTWKYVIVKGKQKGDLAQGSWISSKGKDNNG